MPSFFPFLFFLFCFGFFLTHRRTDMKRKQVVSSKKVIFMYHKSKQEGISSREIQQKQRSCGSAEKNECKKKKNSLGDAGETRRGRRGDSPQNTNHNETEIWRDKKTKSWTEEKWAAAMFGFPPEYKGLFWWRGVECRAGLGRRRGGVHLNTFFFNSLCCRRCFVIVVTPSSLLRRTLTRPRSRNTPPRCGARGSWPRHCRRARV